MFQLPHSRKQDVPSSQEDYQAQFRKDYHKATEEYDKEFPKKYDKELNTALIFVTCLQNRFDEHVLTKVLGWVVPCCGFRTHHPRGL